MGTSIVIEVPRSGALSSVNCPPMVPARAAILASPCPRRRLRPGSKPLPSSATRNRMEPPVFVRLTARCVAPAWRTLLLKASRAMLSNCSPIAGVTAVSAVGSRSSSGAVRVSDEQEATSWFEPH